MIVCHAGSYGRGSPYDKCTPCEAGTFQREDGQSLCHICPAGAFPVAFSASY
jgi:hypothetical protein